MKPHRYAIGWINCPVCFHRIDCVKTRNNDENIVKDVLMKFRGRIVYRERICPQCEEEYKVRDLEFFCVKWVVCPVGSLMVMGEIKL